MHARSHAVSSEVLIHLSLFCFFHFTVDSSILSFSPLLFSHPQHDLSSRHYTTISYSTINDNFIPSHSYRFTTYLSIALFFHALKCLSFRFLFKTTDNMRRRSSYQSTFFLSLSLSPLFLWSLLPPGESANARTDHFISHHHRFNQLTVLLLSWLKSANKRQRDRNVKLSLFVKDASRSLNTNELLLISHNKRTFVVFSSLIRLISLLDHYAWRLAKLWLLQWVMRLENFLRQK